MKLTTTLSMAVAVGSSTSFGAITYLDADFASNTTLADGTAMNLVANEASVANPEDYYVTADGTINNSGAATGNWGERTRANTNGGSVLVGPQGGAGDAPEIRTTATIPMDGIYEIFVIFAGANNWNIEAGLASGSLTTFNPGTATALNTADYDGTAPTGNGGDVGGLFQASLGNATVTGGSLDIYIDDDANGQRSWYEGVGYEFVSAVPEPSTVLLSVLGLLGFGIRRKR